MIHPKSSGRRVRRRRRSVLQLGVALSLCVAALGAMSMAPASAQVSRYGTPVSELAVVTLNAMRGVDTPAVGTAAPTPGPIVNLLAVSQAPAPAPGLNQPRTVSPDGWSSLVVDTSYLTTTTTIAVPATPTPLPATAPANVAPIVVPPTVSGGGGGDARAAYPQLRAQLALEVTGRDAAAAAVLDGVWAQTDPRRLVALYTAFAQVGTPYRFTGNTEGGFDCSGLTSFSWAASGVRIPRTSSDQINAAVARGAEQLQPGDLVWRPGHISMYVGVGQLVVNSPQSGKLVGIKKWGNVQRFGSPF